MATINKIDSIKLGTETSNEYKLGYKLLDEMLCLKEGSIVTIGARPAMGKTTFLYNITLNLLEKYNSPTLFASLENSKEQLALRISSVLTQKSYKDVLVNPDLATQSLNELTSKKYNLYVSDDCYNVGELEQLIEENKSIKFVIIDYIQLLDTDKDLSSFTDRGNDCLERIKKLAKKYGLIVILASQLSRNVEYRENKRPMISDLRQSGNLENDSDVVMFLYRDSYYERENNRPTTEILIAKNRLGKVGTVYLDYDIDKSRFINY